MLFLLKLLNNKVNTTTSTANEMLVIDELDDAYLHCPLTNMNNQWFKVKTKNTHFLLLSDSVK